MLFLRHFIRRVHTHVTSMLPLLIFFVLWSSTFPILAVTYSSVDSGGLWSYPRFNIQANIRRDNLYKEAEKDSVAFWNTCANKIAWFQYWKQTMASGFPYTQWYVSGALNACYNCLDKHLVQNSNKTAIIWCNELGNERKMTYGQMHVEVCRLANGLKSLGIQKGDVVALYMPMTIEAIATMLACARIGAIHVVIFGGSGSESILYRNQDALSVFLKIRNIMP